jgi:hypothetical protein
MVARMEFPALGGGLWFLPVPLLVRMPVAAALIAWGAATNRRWVLPVGMGLSLPTVWLNSPTILVALLPLATAGSGTPAGVWLLAKVPTINLGAAQRRLRTWLGRVPV